MGSWWRRRWRQKTKALAKAPTANRKSRQWKPDDDDDDDDGLGAGAVCGGAGLRLVTRRSELAHLSFFVGGATGGFVGRGVGGLVGCEVGHGVGAGVGRGVGARFAGAAAGDGGRSRISCITRNVFATTITPRTP